MAMKPHPWLPRLSWSIKPSEPPPNMDGGTTPGACSKISTSRQRMLALPTLQISRTIYWAATGGGGCSNSRIPMLTLSSATFRLFKQSFAPSAYLNEGPGYFRPAALRFRCSSHRLDIELGRHTGIPRPDRKCRFCSSTALGDEYHAFKCILGSTGLL